MDQNLHKEHDKLAENKIISDVKKYGWHVGVVEQTDQEQSFAYTIGLWKNYSHPEIIVFGLKPKTMIDILNNVGEKVKGNIPIEIEKDDFDILNELPIQFIKVDSIRISDFLGYGMWFNEYKDFPVLQIIWTDRKGRFPWNSNFENEFMNKQIILNKIIEEKVEKACR